MNRTTKNIAKLAGSATFVVGFAATLILAGPQGGVEEVEADIVRKLPRQAITGTNFGEIIENSGMPPRAYKINDNEVYFAVGHTTMSPYQVLDKYQQRFVDAGINKKKYMEVPRQMYKISPADLIDAKKRASMAPAKPETVNYLTDMLMGGVVPLQIDPDYVSMGGMVPRHKAAPDKRVEEIFEAWQPDRLETLNNGGEGFRFIDAQRINERLTRVTSVWADENFDFRKMDHPERFAIKQQTAAPRCPGCRVAMEMDSMQTNEPYTSSSYAMPNGDAQQLSNFYQQQMQDQGWKLSGSAEALSYVRKHYPQLHDYTDTGLLHFTRGKHDLTISIIPGQNGETRVHSFQRKP